MRAIKKIIANANRHLPRVWPLQQFVAVNPLWNSIGVNFLELAEELSHQVGLKATLPLNQYHQQYQQGLIANADIRRVITSWLSKKSLTMSLSFDQKNILENSLFDLMTSSIYQNLLNLAEQQFDFDQEVEPSLLLSQQWRDYFYDDPCVWVEQNCVTWLAAFFDQGQAAWSIPSKCIDLFAAWQDVMQHQNRKWGTFLSRYPTQPLDFIEAIVITLNIPQVYLADYIDQIVWRLKGWGGYIKWLTEYPNHPWIDKTASLTELIAMWLAYECYFMETHQSKLKAFVPFSKTPSHQPKPTPLITALWLEMLTPSITLSSSSSEISQLQGIITELACDHLALRFIWQTAWEKPYHYDLMQGLTLYEPPKMALPKAQWLVCMDVRSEGLRRSLEYVAEQETFGVAGFFGFAFQFNDKVNHTTTWQCPSLMTPQHVVMAMAASESFLKSSTQSIKNTMNQTKRQILSPFALFEMVGLWFSTKLAAKTAFPYLCAKLTAWLTDKNQERQFHWFKDANVDALGYCIEDAAAVAENLLKTLGLTKQFSPWVVLCAHEASSENNTYQAALDCGACGGNGGAVNARVAAMAFNHPQIRDELTKRGIFIPKTTYFIAACYNTTQDVIRWFDEDLEQVSLAELKSGAEKACEHARAERLGSLPGNQNVRKRSTDWAELIPEWGLTNNASMVIGPRWLTREMNLNRRTFLHSYHPDSDPTHIQLEGILTAPLFVAHAINMQYYLSTTDPDLYGSGNKAIHNPISQIGVMQGNHSDLQTGLPSQSVVYQNQLRHEPRRLLVIIYAKKAAVDQIINKHPKLKHLVDGQWLFLHVIEPR